MPLAHDDSPEKIPAAMTSLSASLLVAGSAMTSNLAAGDFLKLGFTHILPYGLDHVLFVLSLFFCCRGFGVLLAQVTLFTVAHSLSLGVAVASGWGVPSQLVEVAIALSIAFVAVENLVRQQPGRWSYLLTFLFGLVHGLGFADAFHEAAGSVTDFAVALLSFNVGLESGQLVVVLLAFVLVGRFWERAWYRHAVVIPASAAIAVVGFAWAALRMAA
jgi:hypothetical protein